MVIGSLLGSGEQSGFPAHMRVVRFEMVASPRIKAFTASISFAGPSLSLTYLSSNELLAILVEYELDGPGLDAGNHPVPATGIHR